MATSKLENFLNIFLKSSGDIKDRAIKERHVGFDFSTALGTWVSGADATTYQAETDGFVTAYRATGNGIITGFTDGSTPPTTIRVKDAVGGNVGAFCSICMPVRKGDYWKVGTADAVWWIPLS